MKKTYVVLTVVLIMLLTASVAYADSSASRNFAAPLSGGEEVPPRATKGTGVATFKFSDDGTELEYKLNVANIENVVAAHIHCGAAGVNGPVGVTLYSGAPAGGRFDGRLARATVSAPDAGNVCGWVTLADVLAAVQSGNTYVNVHTSDGVLPNNTGAGDFASGEIRGQIK